MKKILLILCVFIVSFTLKAQSKQKIDSLIIESSLDPGSGPDFNLIKIYFHKKKFVVTYMFYDFFDRESYNRDSEILKLREAYRSSGYKEMSSDYLKKIREIRERYVRFYTVSLNLRNRKYKDYLSELYRVSSMSQSDLEQEKNKDKMYLHGVTFCSDFYKSNKRDRICASGLEKDNFGTIFNFITHTFDLYRKQVNDQKFNSKTFGY